MKLTSKKSFALALAAALSLGGTAFAGGAKGGGMGSQAWPAGSGGHAQNQTQDQTRSQTREQVRTRTQAHTQDGHGLNDQWIREQAQAQSRFEMRTRTTTGSTQGE